MKKFLTIVLIISMIFSTYCVSFAASTLKDIKGTKYETAVKSLVDLGIISGYPDGTFKPDNAISRSELSKLLVISYGLEKNVKSHMGKTQFSDVNAVNNHWASGYINLSTDYKFVTGYPDGTFKADNTVTYAEAMTMCVRVLGYSKEAESKGTWPTNYINKAQDLKLTKNISIKSYDKEATRGDIAILIWNMIK